MPRINNNLARVYIDGSGYHNVVTLDSSKPAGRRPRALKISSPTANYPRWRNLLSNNATLDLYVCDLENPSTNIKIGSTTVPAGTNGSELIDRDITITDTSNKLTGKALGFFFYFNAWSYTNPTDMANMMLFAGSTYPFIDFDLTTDILTYSIIKVVTPAGAGTITSPSGTSAIPGTTVSLAQTPGSNYEFVKWQLGDSDISGNSFTMPWNNVTLKAVYKEAHKTVKYCVNGEFVECIPHYCPGNGEDFVEVEPQYCPSNGADFVPCSHT